MTDLERLAEACEDAAAEDIMSDHLLRLARIVESIASGDGPHWPTEDVRQLIRDLEAAPQPERRTITREEFRLARALLVDGYEVNDPPDETVRSIATAWRLTVEDA